MLRSERKAAAAAEAAAAMMGGRTARVCDACLCKRAHWFCAADDAFLCQACDVSVHSANELARRHDRIRLETASLKSTHQGQAQSQAQLPPWLKGFTRKARTPRPNKQISSTKASVFSLVPEISNDEGFSIDDNEDEHRQFHHHHQQVPVFDPLVDDEKFSLTHELDDFGDGFLPSEIDLAEFVADVESLLVRQEQEQEQEHDQNTIVKVKDEKEEEELVQDWSFKGEEIEEEEINKVEDEVKAFEQELKVKKKMKKKNIFLRLNYDAIITAWDTQSSPYTTGDRPEFDLGDCWEEEWGLHENGEKGGWRNDGEREARVSRYREKRRTRLFSKKIRYQVRKLNAEKRPRMKGRFVKRTPTPLC